MRILVTGASGFVGSLLVPRLLSEGHAVRALGRDPARVSAALAPRRRGDLSRPDLAGEVEVLRGDALSGEGLAAALAGVDVAYYLIHSMERRPPPARPSRSTSASSSRRATSPTPSARAGVARIVYLGGPAPARSRRLAAPRQPRGGRAHPARCRPRLARPARLDRDRRALALVSLSRPPRRAPAGAHPARVALLPHRADRRARRRSRCSPPRRPPPQVAGHLLDIGGPDVLSLRGDDLPDRRADARAAPVLGFGVNITPSRRASPRRSPRRTPI